MLSAGAEAARQPQGGVGASPPPPKGPWGPAPRGQQEEELPYPWSAPTHFPIHSSV